MAVSSLRNIISNATKFTKNQDQINVRVYPEKQQTVIEIEDTGYGMNTEMVEDLFDRDKFAENLSNSGLGLLLCKEFLDKNDATLEVFSEKGVGSRFVVRI